MKIRFVTLLVLLGLSSMALAQQVPTSQDYMQAAQDALQGNDYTTAIQDYLLAIKKDPNNWEAYQNLGGCYIQLHKMDDAKAAYDQSLKINPGNPALIKFVAKVWGGPQPTPTATTLVPTATPVMTLTVVIPPSVAATSTPTYFYTVVNTPTPPPFGTPTPVPVYVPLGEMTTPTMGGKAENEVIRPPFAGTKPYVFQALPRYNLPEKNTVTMEFGGAGWFGSAQNFNDYFGSGLNPSATSHAGLEADLGADYALIKEFQLGLHLEGMFSPVTHAYLGSQFVEWDSYALGLAVSAKYLMPLNSAMSLIAHLEGGYYSLIASQIISNQGSAGSLGLGGSAFGGLAALEMEFFQVADKSLALDFGLGYRFLTFNNITGTGTWNGQPVSGALTNPGNGKPAYDDYSGPRVSFSIRFVH